MDGEEDEATAATSADAAGDEAPADGFTPSELERVWTLFWAGEALPALTEQRVSIMGAFYDALNRIK